MAGELVIAGSFTFNKAGVNITKNWNVTIDVTGNYSKSEVLQIGVADEVLQFGDIATMGWVLLHNLDATNFIQVDQAAITTTSTGKLKPGDWALIRWGASTSVHVKANVAPCLLEYVLLSD